MTRASLLALAARVEQSEGADRQIDAEIVWRTTPGIVGIERGPLDDDGLDFLFEWWPRRPWSASWLTVPAFTASLDAAASLVPEGWGIELSRYWVAADERPRWRAHLTGGLGNLHGYCKEAMSGALALTAAALRAMAEEAGDE